MKLEVVIFKKMSEYDLDVCFESYEDCLGLMGPSGSGKSMVLKCIAGIMTPDAGRIVLDDEVLFDSDLKINISPQKRKIGYMFQNYALFDHMNVYQNIAAPLKAHHEDKQVIKEKVQQIMKDFQIDDLQKRYPRQLSGGQKQRVALARLLVYDTNLVLLDEHLEIIDVDKNALKAKYLSDVSFSDNDYVLNTLLNLLPQEIHLHLVSPSANLDFINTLQLIFENRIKICTECNICNLYKKIYVKTKKEK